MSTSTPAAGVRRRLILHAGTHKTASSDIQSRLLRSRSLLEQENVHYRFPVQDVHDFKPLTKAITRGDCHLWCDYLELMARGDGDVLLSGEQFAPRLTERKTIRKLRSLAHKYGYELTIVIFIRSQLDYINSRYAYTLKRFYHTTTFNEYVQEVFAGRLPSSGTFTGPNAKRSDVFDFWNYFSALLNERKRGLDVRFIPFRQTEPDPLRQLLKTLDLNPDLNWAASRSEALNASPGPRATWLARQVGLRLAQHGISHRVIENSSAIIPLEQSFRRWKDGSYWGFDRSRQGRATAFQRQQQPLRRGGLGTALEGGVRAGQEPAATPASGLRTWSCRRNGGDATHCRPRVAAHPATSSTQSISPIAGSS